MSAPNLALLADGFLEILAPRARSRSPPVSPRLRDISQADLARATDTDPRLTGRALETLLLRGWVRRKRSKEDRREYILELGALVQRRARNPTFRVILIGVDTSPMPAMFTDVEYIEFAGRAAPNSPKLEWLIEALKSGSRLEVINRAAPVPGGTPR
jgi:hypothetical protein